MKYVTKAKEPQGTTEIRMPLYESEDSDRILNAITQARPKSILGAITETREGFTDIEGITCLAIVKVGVDDEGHDEFIQDYVIPKALTSTGVVVEICDESKEPLGVYANIYKGAIRFVSL